jgi:hypothetical protein
MNTILLGNFQDDFGNAVYPIELSVFKNSRWYYFKGEIIE